MQLKIVCNLIVLGLLILFPIITWAKPMPVKNVMEYSLGNPLIDAADAGNKELLVRLLNSGYYINQRGFLGVTALMRASYHNHIQAVQALIGFGSDVNLQDEGGATALHYAVRAKNVDIIELLLKAGANSHIKDVLGYNALMRASSLDNKNIYDALDKSFTLTEENYKAETSKGINNSHEDGLIVTEVVKVDEEQLNSEQTYDSNLVEKPDTQKDLKIAKADEELISVILDGFESVEGVVDAWDKLGQVAEFKDATIMVSAYGNFSRSQLSLKLGFFSEESYAHSACLIALKILPALGCRIGDKEFY